MMTDPCTRTGVTSRIKTSLIVIYDSKKEVGDPGHPVGDDMIMSGSLPWPPMASISLGICSHEVCFIIFYYPQIILYMVISDHSLDILQPLSTSLN